MIVWGKRVFVLECVLSAQELRALLAEIDYACDLTHLQISKMGKPQYVRRMFSWNCT